MLSAYLQELERDLARRLPREDVQARLAEAEAHLQEGIEGRIELGMEPEAAEREAVEAFGLTRRIARATPAVGAKARVGLLGTGYASMLLFLLFAPSFRDLYPATFEAVVLAWAVIGIAFAVVAFRSRRPLPGLVIRATLLGALAVWLTGGTTWLDLSPYGGGGVVPPGGAASQMREAAERLAGKAADLQELDAGLKTVHGPQGVEGLRGLQGYHVPVVQGWSYEKRVAFTAVSDPKTAVEAWRDVVGPTANLRSEVDRLRTMLDAIPQAQAASTFRNLVVVAPSFLSPTLSLAVAAVVIDFGFGGLGLLSARARRRPRGGLRA